MHALAASRAAHSGNPSKHMLARAPTCMTHCQQAASRAAGGAGARLLRRGARGPQRGAAARGGGLRAAQPRAARAPGAAGPGACFGRGAGPPVTGHSARQQAAASPCRAAQGCGCSRLQRERRRASPEAPCAPVTWRGSAEAARSALARRLDLLGRRNLELSALWQDQGFANRRDSMG